MSEGDHRRGCFPSAASSANRPRCGCCKGRPAVGLGKAVRSAYYAFRQHSDIHRLPLSYFPFSPFLLSLFYFTLLYCMTPVDLARACVSQHSFPLPKSTVLHIRTRENKPARECRPHLVYYPFSLSNVTLFLSLSELDSAERTHSASTRRFALTVCGTREQVGGGGDGQDAGNEGEAEE
ncbi:hypothetical protein BC827DRAFT_725105 [Russula dissimulans]|nr:hypothetical protein BC827DRAFT_725105 [Russula dissimulans]